MLLEITRLLHGKEDFLDHIYATRIGSRFHAATLVGARSNHPMCLQLVGRLSQRLVLSGISGARVSRGRTERRLRESGGGRLMPGAM